MKFSEGRLTELRLDGSGAGALAWIDCAPDVIPDPGRYTMALGAGGNECLESPLFSAGSNPNGFLAAPPIPAGWFPGVELSLRGPFGRGFSMPAGTRRLALMSLGSGPARLMPLVTHALQEQAAVALFIDGLIPELPPAVEVSPMSALPEALDWADYLALDLPLERLQDLRTLLKLDNRVTSLPIPAQALIDAPMPCLGIADCGVCALSSKKGTKLVCKHGPVFDIEKILSIA